MGMKVRDVGDDDGGGGGGWGEWVRCGKRIHTHTHTHEAHTLVQLECKTWKTHTYTKRKHKNNQQKSKALALANKKEGVAERTWVRKRTKKKEKKNIRRSLSHFISTLNIFLIIPPLPLRSLSLSSHTFSIALSYSFIHFAIYLNLVFIWLLSDCLCEHGCELRFCVYNHNDSGKAQFCFNPFYYWHTKKKNEGIHIEFQVCVAYPYTHIFISIPCSNNSNILRKKKPRLFFVCICNRIFSFYCIVDVSSMPNAFAIAICIGGALAIQLCILFHKITPHHPRSLLLTTPHSTNQHHQLYSNDIFFVNSIRCSEFVFYIFNLCKFSLRSFRNQKHFQEATTLFATATTTTTRT